MTLSYDLPISFRAVIIAVFVMQMCLTNFFLTINPDEDVI